MQLKGEISWGENDDQVLSNHGFGALKINDLISAINTIPLHTQLNIPEDSLQVRFYFYIIKYIIKLMLFN